jgi:hypothetical protein
MVYERSYGAESEVLAIGYELREAPIAQHNDVPFGIG